MRVVLQPAGVLILGGLLALLLAVIAILFWIVAPQRAGNPFEQTGVTRHTAPHGSAGTGAALASVRIYPIDLTRTGGTDWLIYGVRAGVAPAQSLARKAVTAPALSPAQFVGKGRPATYANDPRPFFWSDGAGDHKTGVDVRTGVVTAGVGSGFRLIVTPTVGKRQTLKLWVGGEGIRSKVFVRFDDGAPVGRYTESLQNRGNSEKVSYRSLYTIPFTAGKPSEKLIVSYIVGEDGVVKRGAHHPEAPSDSNVSLQAVALD